MLEGVQQCLERRTLQAEGRQVGGQFLGVQALAFLQAQHVELGRVDEQAAVIGACLHQQGEGGQLGGAVVDVQAVEVLLQDARGW